MDFDIDEFIKKYDVHDETVAFLRAAAAAGAQPYYEIGVEAARQSFYERNELMAGKTEFEGSEQDIIIPSSDVKDGLPITVYKPKTCDSLQAPAILVYFHGGGHVVGSRKTHETVCKILARDSSCIVVNVEYRLAPEHKFPADHDDANCVVAWVAKNKTVVGGAADSKLGVCGDSAGGTLAASACHELHQLIQFAVLIYPSVDCIPYPSAKEFRDGPVISTEIIKWYTAQYIKEEEMTSPRCSVIRQKEFHYLPPTIIIVAELDPLRDGCHAYYDVLKKAGVDVEITTVKGVPHGFWSWPALFKQTCSEAHGAATKFIKDKM